MVDFLLFFWVFFALWSTSVLPLCEPQIPINKTFFFLQILSCTPIVMLIYLVLYWNWRNTNWYICNIQYGEPPRTELLNKVESKAFRIIDSPLIDCLQCLTFRHNVATFAILYRYFQANWSSELANCILPSTPAASPHTIFYSLSFLFCSPPLCKS